MFESLLCICDSYLHFQLRRFPVLLLDQDKLFLLVLITFAQICNIILGFNIHLKYFIVNIFAVTLVRFV